MLKWGIVGCGAISSDFSLSISRIRSPRHQLVAAAARSSLESAQKFAKKFNMPKSYGSYEELFADPEINAVYIGNLNSDHLATALAAITAGKAVLCEKPLTLSPADSQRIFEAGRTRGVLVIEGLWSRFNPTYARIRQLLTAHTPSSFQANFTVKIEQIDRLAKPEYGGGAIFDIGIYAIQLSNLVFGGKSPTHVHATGMLNELGCDIAEAISLQYPDGGISSILLDARCAVPDICEARIFFRPGGEFMSARIFPPFWAPTRLELTKPDGSVVIENHPIYPNLPTDDGLKFNFANSQGLAYEAEAFADAFEKWQASRGTANVVLDHPLRTHNDTLIDAQVIDTVIAQLKKEALAKKSK